MFKFDVLSKEGEIFVRLNFPLRWESFVHFISFKTNFNFFWKPITNWKKEDVCNNFHSAFTKVMLVSLSTHKENWKFAHNTRGTFLAIFPVCHRKDAPITPIFKTQPISNTEKLFIWSSIKIHSVYYSVLIEENYQ